MEIGKKTSSMDMELKLGQMVQNMKGTMNTERNMEQVHLNGLMDQCILVNSIIIIFTERVFIHGATEENTKVNGETIKCTERELLPGLMGVSMLENM